MFRLSKLFIAILLFAFAASFAFAAGAQDDGMMEAEEGVPIYGGTLTWSYWNLNFQNKINMAEDPLSCVAYGTGKALEEMDILKKVLFAD